MNFKEKILLYIIIAIFVTSMHTYTYANNTVNTSIANTLKDDAGSLNAKLDKRINSSVNKLMAFGIVQGKEDGKYYPEDQLTRQEFTKIMVDVLGMGDAAAIPSEQSPFRDIGIASGWAVGYINLAASQGIVNGNDKGLFNPFGKVTLSESVTIILRALGYRDEFLKGQWPHNYILKAAELGLLDSIEMDKDAAINRGIAALLINNAMDVDIIKSYPDGRGYYVTNTNLLEDRQNLYKLENVKIIDKENVGEYINVDIEFTQDTHYKNNKYEDGDIENFFLKDEFSSQLYVGIDGDIYINEDEKILYIDYNDVRDYDSKVFINEIITNDYNEKPIKKIKLSTSDEYIEISKDCDIYINGEAINNRDFEKYLDQDVFGTFILDDDDELDYANLISWQEENLYIKSIDTEAETFYAVDTNDGNEREIEIEDFSSEYKIYLVQEDKRVEITLNELLVGDIINISEEQESKEVLIYVWRESVNGKLARLSGGSYGQRISFLLTGQETKYYFADEFSYSYDKGKKVSREKDETVSGINKLGEFYSEKVDVYRNWRNEVVYIQGDFRTNSDLYGIFRQYGDTARGEIQIYIKTGSSKVYAFEEVDEYERMKENNIPVGSIIKYSIGKSKKLKNLSDNVEDDIIRLDENIKTIRAGDDFGEDYAVIDGKKVNIDLDTIYFDYTNSNRYRVKALKWNKFKNKKVLEDVEVIAVEEDDVLKLLVIRDNIEGIQEDTIPGYVLNQYRLGDKYYVEVQSNIHESKTQHLIDDDYENLFLNGRVVLYGINTDNKFMLIEDDEVEFVSGELDSVSGKKIFVEGERYRISDETQVFRGDEKVGLNDLKKSNLVAMYVEDNMALAVELLDSKDAKKIGKGILRDIDREKEDCFTIEIDGEEVMFSKNPEIDYVFKDGYIETSEKNKDITEVLEDILNGKEPFVKFSYDEDTDEIYNMWIDN